MNRKLTEDSSDPSVHLHPVLATKLYIPPHPAYLVSRERLMTAMSSMLQRKLTLVIAPPGFGKTMMISDWIRSRNIRAGWISLDKGENDLQRFWGYVVIAFNRLLPGIGRKARSLLQSPVAFSIDKMVAWLLNDLFDVTDDLVLVLDDYYVIDSEEVHRSLAFFVERLPERIHLCIVSRKELPFPVATLRVKGQLGEIGIDELKFTKEEISSFWHRQTGDLPNESSLRLLAHRTEGWAAGIQLAALSQLGGQRDALRHFSGNHRYVVDYLMEEVFQSQPEPVRSFLMRSSVLERMNGELCAAIMEQSIEAGMLQRIEQAGLFVIPLDDERYWFRYHHLFRDFLRNRFLQTFGDDAVSLNLKASEWFERGGYTEEAIDHALAARGFERAANLLRSIDAELLNRREWATLRGWLDQLPEEIAQRMEIVIVQVWTELFMEKFERIPEHLGRIRNELPRLSQTNEALFSRMREELVIAENFYMLISGKYDLAYELLTYLYEREDLGSGDGLFVNSGLELNEGTVPFIRGYYGCKGSIRTAERYHQMYDAFIRKHHLEHLSFCAHQRTAMSELAYERGDNPEALRYAETAIVLGRQNGIMGAVIPSIIVKARIQWDNGNPEAAMDSVLEVMEFLRQSHNQESLWHGLLHAYLVRCHLAKGEIEPVERWLEACKFSLETETIEKQEFEWLTFIRVLAAKGSDREALICAERLLRTAENNGRLMTELEARIWIAALYGKMGRAYECMLQMHEALALGEREGYKRIFLDAAEMPDLLRQYAEVRRKGYMPELQTGVSLGYLKKVQAADNRRTAQAHATDGVQSEGGIDALTARETEVLLLIAEGLSNKEIARRLVLTEGTVKLHLHHIYGKLQAKGRVQAIHRAKEKNLIP
ncbi:LuxR C-terminal-related transcriptional regulator [Cohnella suwonensis]|uniref:LuxR C-terminal-related transcriptional regulator n=1 Tax=Cohnella suwonensis TaxID=696072 RepID=A0ABW0LYT1_9BACL